MTAPALGFEAIHEELLAYTEHVSLRDGAHVHLRGVTAQDRSAVAAFFAGLSLESQRYRFFRAHPSLLPEELDRLISLDPEDTVALAAMAEDATGERLVGIAELAAVHDANPVAGHRQAEFAVAVGDADHGRGIGSVLLGRIAAVARRAGIDEMVAYVLPDNSSMLDVIHHSGLKVVDHHGSGPNVVVLSVAAKAPSPEARAGG